MNAMPATNPATRRDEFPPAGGASDKGQGIFDAVLRALTEKPTGTDSTVDHSISDSSGADASLRRTLQYSDERSVDRGHVGASGQTATASTTPAAAGNLTPAVVTNYLNALNAIGSGAADPGSLLNIINTQNTFQNALTQDIAEGKAGGPDPNSGIYHYTPGTTGGKAASNFEEKFGSTPDANVRATRQDLGLSDSDTFILDVGGEGAKLDMSNGMQSGNVDALNLNWQPKMSPGQFTVDNGPNHTPVAVNSNGNVAIPNLVRPASSWGSNPSYPFADKSVDAVMMEGAPLTEKNVQEMTRVVSDKGWIMLNIDPSFKPQVDEIVKARGGQLFESDNPNGFKTYYIGPKDYTGPSPAEMPDTWISVMSGYSVPDYGSCDKAPVSDAQFGKFVKAAEHDEL